MVEEMNWQLIVMEAGGGHWANMLHQITFANTEVSQLYYIIFNQFHSRRPKNFRMKYILSFKSHENEIELKFYLCIIICL